MTNSTENSAPINFTNIETQNYQVTSEEDPSQASKDPKSYGNPRSSKQKRTLDTPGPSAPPKKKYTYYGQKCYKPKMSVRPGDTYRFRIPQTFTYVDSDHEPDSVNQSENPAPPVNPNQDFQRILEEQNQKLELLSTRFDALHQELHAIREYMVVTRKDLLEFKKARDAKQLIVTVGLEE
ncbi:hypothetical protein QVD17_30564 [Tagetes erecta]|uniref:Uncharacterized protein n=1 Tax=Tagetes erecta TaxID=13708 RepID=A0AAD8K858_TARER|nr:hypothetical protein QVD17_30564 [Tagetes erecta]